MKIEKSGETPIIQRPFTPRLPQKQETVSAPSLEPKFEDGANLHHLPEKEDVEVTCRLDGDDDTKEQEARDRIDGLPQEQRLALARKSTDRYELAALGNTIDDLPEMAAALAENPAVDRVLAELHVNDQAAICRCIDDPARLKNICENKALPNLTRVAAAGNEKTASDTAVATCREVLESGTPEDRAAVADSRAVRLLPSEVLDRIAADEVPAVRDNFIHNPGTGEVMKKLSPQTARLVVTHTGDRELLKQCATGADPELRLAAAANYRVLDLLDKETLLQLAKDSDAEVRGALLKKPLVQNRGPFPFPPRPVDHELQSKVRALLTQLATDPDLTVRAAVAVYPKAPALLSDDLLAKLATDKDKHVRAALAANPASRAAVLLALASDKDATVRAAVAANRSSPQELSAEALERLATDKDEDVRRELAENSSLDNPAYKDKVQVVLTKLINDPSSRAARRAALANPNAPTDLLAERAKRELAEYEDVQRQIEALDKEKPVTKVPDDDENDVPRQIKSPKEKPGVRKPNPMASKRAKLEARDNTSLLLALATNKNTPKADAVKILLTLAKQRDADIQWEVARNPRVSPEALQELPQKIRLRLALSQHALPEALINLAQGEANEDILQALADNPQTPSVSAETVLGKLASPSCSKESRLFVARHERATPEILAPLAQDNDPAVRMAVAENDKTPVDVLNRLKDPQQERDPEVRKAAQKTLAARQAPVK